MEQISLFERSSASKPLAKTSLRDFLKKIQNGYWKHYQDKVIKAKTKEDKTRIKRFNTPCVTLSGVYEKNRVGLPNPHSGFICIDIDGDDNKGLMKKRDVLEDDPYVFGVFTSISGTGLAVLFKIKPKKHYEYFNGIQEYLYNEYGIVVDPGVKDPARLRFVSYDKSCYYDFKKKVFDQPKAYQPVPALAEIEHDEEDIEDLVKQVEKTGVDIAPNYHEWYIMGQALARLGEKGRKYFHRLSKFNEGYDKDESDFQFDNCINQESKGLRDDKVGLASVFFYAKEAGIVIAPTVKIKGSSGKKKIILDHKKEVLLSIEGHKQEKGIYTYHIWGFKVVFKKDESPDVTCLGLNHECTSDFLFNRGIRRNGKVFYRIANNIVEIVTWDSIMDMIVQEGVKLPKDFTLKWDEQADVITRKVILNAVQAQGRKVMERDVILKEFNPDQEEFIKDTEQLCYLFFRNGIVQVDKKQHWFIPWDDEGMGINKDGIYVWKENIIDKDFKYTKKKSLIQTILENAIGKKNWDEIKSAIGYMVHTHINEEGCEILFCIDKNVGDLNEGGNGKDFFGQIIKHVRKLTVIPGKSMQFSNQFTFERIDRDTQVTWIEDLSRQVRMEMLYNLNNGINVRRMHTQPFMVRCKIGISLQHLINIEGTSDQRRQIFLLFSDYYSQRGGIGKAHNDRNIFGESWTGWDEYYSLIVECVQFYLKHGLLRMDMGPILELRKQELSGDGSFDALTQGTWYTTESAIKLCWGEEEAITTERFMAFRKKLSQWAKISGLQVEAERKFLNGKQSKAIRIVAPMKYSSKHSK